MEESQKNEGDKAAPPEAGLALEREKIELERERLVLERERLENERLRHRETVELNNHAAGRVVVPASTFALSLLVALLFGGAIGAWVVATQFRPSPATIAASVARAIHARPFDDDPDGTNVLSTVDGPSFRPAGRAARGSGYLLILD